MGRDEIEVRRAAALAALTPAQRLSRWWTWWGIPTTAAVTLLVLAAVAAWVWA